MCTNQKYLDRQEEQNKYAQRKRDIDLYGYAGAFRRDSVPSLEKYEWQIKNNRLKEEY